MGFILIAVLLLASVGSAQSSRMEVATVAAFSADEQKFNVASDEGHIALLDSDTQHKDGKVDTAEVIRGEMVHTDAGGGSFGLSQVARTDDEGAFGQVNIAEHQQLVTKSLQVEPVEAAPPTYSNMESASSCDAWCRTNGLGNGRVIGEAPKCGASCRKCHGKCEIVTKTFGYSDYGNTCLFGNKVCCCTRAARASGESRDQDNLAVMNFNTYLLEVNVIVRGIGRKPDLEQRAIGIATYFNTMPLAAVPDVLVFDEILAIGAERMMQQLCTPQWRKNSGDKMDHAHFLACGDSSNFVSATKPGGHALGLDPVKSGGVVVLVKRGNELVEARYRKFERCAGDDCMANKGYWCVHVKKGTQDYFVFGTHTNAYQQRQVRLEQFAQMRADADLWVPTGARLLFTGDMNGFTDEFTHKGRTVPKSEADETQDMLSALGSNGHPAQGGQVIPRGFWMGLQEEVTVSADAEKNPYIRYNKEERLLGSQMFDWVVTPGPGDAKFVHPVRAPYQFVPVKATSCWTSALKDDDGATIQIDDLSDHYAIFARLCYNAARCDEPFWGPPLETHYGSRNQLPRGPKCS